MGLNMRYGHFDGVISEICNCIITEYVCDRKGQLNLWDAKTTKFKDPRSLVVYSLRDARSIINGLVRIGYLQRDKKLNVYIVKDVGAIRSLEALPPANTMKGWSDFVASHSSTIRDMTLDELGAAIKLSAEASDNPAEFICRLQVRTTRLLGTFVRKQSLH